MKGFSFDLTVSIITGIFMCLIILPVFALFTETSFEELIKQFKSPLVLSAIVISLKTSLIVVLVSLLLGIPAAYLLATKQFKGKEILDTLVDLPICMPPLVAGLALLILFGGSSRFGSFFISNGIDIIFSTKGIIIAQVFVSAPFLIKSTRSAFESIDKNVTNVSLTLGASKFYTFRKVLIPLAKNGIYAGIVMTWARALGEFGATSMVAGCIPGKTETMTVAVYQNAMSGKMNSSIAIALLLIIFSFTSLLIFKSRVRAQTGPV
ncbi:MAG: molybdate ABC transporter permease subunit [Spirochaetes bacterium]|nr:molybdate ABC transporter permease subunit [Spirochaetota bacterium]